MNPNTRRLALAGMAEFAAFSVGAGGTVAFLLFIRDALFPAFSYYHLLIFVLRVALLGAIPVTVGALLAIWIRRRVLGHQAPAKHRVFGPLWGRFKETRWLYGLVLASYLLTWSFGVPEVLSNAVSLDVESSIKSAEFYDQPLQPVHTYSGFAAPVIPGIIVFSHYHSGGKLHEWGGFKVYGWWFLGYYQLFEYAVVVG